MSERLDTLCRATHAAGNVCCMPAGHIGPHNDGGCSWAFDDRQRSTKAKFSDEDFRALQIGTASAVEQQRAADEIVSLQARVDDLESVIERVANLAGYQWPSDRLTYPKDEIGQHAAAAVKLCEDELRKAIHGE